MDCPFKLTYRRSKSDEEFKLNSKCSHVAHNCKTDPTLQSKHISKEVKVYLVTYKIDKIKSDDNRDFSKFIKENPFSEVRVRKEMNTRILSYIVQKNE